MFVLFFCYYPPFTYKCIVTENLRSETVFECFISAFYLIHFINIFNSPHSPFIGSSLKAPPFASF